jgi:hypothetical protein
MSRLQIALAVVAFALAALGLTACGHAHLGPRTGVATREAFEAQRASEPETTPEFGADVARGALATERAAPAAAAPGATATASGGVAGASAAAPAAPRGNTGAWPGSSAGMKLEAK